jgi:hypothetical protein
MAMGASTLLPQQQPKREERQQQHHHHQQQQNQQQAQQHQQQQQQQQQAQQAQHQMLQLPEQADDMLVEASKAAVASTMTPTRKPSRRASTFSYPQVVAASDPAPGSAGRSTSLTLDVAVSFDSAPNRTSSMSMSEISIGTPNSSIRKSNPPRRPSTFSYPQVVAAPSPEADDSSASLSIFPSEMEGAVRAETPRSRTSSSSSMSSNSSHSMSNKKPPRRLLTFNYPQVVAAPSSEADGACALSSLFPPEMDVAALMEATPGRTSSSGSIGSTSSHSQSNSKPPRRPSTFSYPQTFAAAAAAAATRPSLVVRVLSGGDSPSSAFPAATTRATTVVPPSSSRLEFTLPSVTIEPRPSTVMPPPKEGDDPNQTPSQQSSNVNASSLPCPKPTRRTVRFPSRRTAMEEMRNISRLSNYTINDITAVWGDKEERRERRQALYHDVQELCLGRQSSDKNVNFTTLGIADEVGPAKAERRGRRQAALKAVLGGQLAQRLSSLDSATVSPLSFDELEPQEAPPVSTSSPTSSDVAPPTRGRSFSTEMANAYRSVAQEAERKARQAAVELHRNVKTLLKMTSNSSLSASVDSGDDNNRVLRDDIVDIIVEEGSQEIRFFQEEMEDYNNRKSNPRRTSHGLQPDDDLLQGLSFEDDEEEEGNHCNYNDDFDEDDFKNSDDDEDRHPKDESQDETVAVDLWQGFRVTTL